MKHITNLREARQMQCQGSELCEVVSITLGDLETIAQVAEANLRDQFAMSALTGLLANKPTSISADAEAAYQSADAMLKARNERTTTS